MRHGDCVASDQLLLLSAERSINEGSVVERLEALHCVGAFLVELLQLAQVIHVEQSGLLLS